MIKIQTKKPFKKVGTHHGKFHADEVMATAILKEIFEIEVTRTRDPKVLKELDIVYDVGGGVFDHHGIDKVYREDGTPYAACGLIWREYGKDVVRIKNLDLNEEQVSSVVDYVDRVLIEGIDALDNGMRPWEGDIPMMTISSMISGFNPPWYADPSVDEAFYDAVALASMALNNTIIRRFSVLRAEDIVVKAYENRDMSNVLVLDRFCPWGETLRKIDVDDEVLFVVYPRQDSYAMQTVRGDDGKDKKYLPKSWAGKEHKELAVLTDVEDAVFCHTGRFIVVTKSFDGIMKMAKLAIVEPEERKQGGFRGVLARLFSKHNDR